jgi:hypothetical protein
MTGKIVLALFCSVVALGVMPIGATEPLAIEWNRLVPDKAFEDPFERLSDDQLQDVGYAARVRSLIAANKIKSDGPDAKAAAEIEQKLGKAGIDIGYLLSLRDQVRRIRTMQANAVEPGLIGKEVSLVAFVVPAKRSGDLVTECFLVGNYDACSHSSPPPANQAVYLRSPEGFVLPSTRTPVRVTGRLQEQPTTRLRVRAGGLVEMTAAYSMTEHEIELPNHNPDLKLSKQ